MREPIIWIKECSGPNTGRIHELPAGKHVIGRSRLADIVLDDPDVSRRHALLTAYRDRIVVKDLASKNGVIRNGMSATVPITMQHADRFRVGSTELLIQHPTTQVTGALRRAGELTSTALLEPPTAPPAPTRGVVTPIFLAALLVGLAAIVTWIASGLADPG